MLWLALLEFFVILLAISVVLILYRQFGRLEALKKVWLPVFLWFAFGTGDAIMTITGTYEQASREYNPAARWFMEMWGWQGYVLLTVLWIALWSCTYFFVSGTRYGHALGLFQFYSLSFGHFIGFASWMKGLPTIEFVKFVRSMSGSPLVELPLILVAGAILAFLHTKLERQK